jgi:hypothetical protein
MLLSSYSSATSAISGPQALQLAHTGSDAHCYERVRERRELVSDCVSQLAISLVDSPTTVIKGKDQAEAPKTGAMTSSARSLSPFLPSE